MSTAVENAYNDIREEIDARVATAKNVMKNMTETPSELKPEMEKQIRRDLFKQLHSDPSKHFCQFSLNELRFTAEGDDLDDNKLENMPEGLHEALGDLKIAISQGHVSHHKFDEVQLSFLKRLLGELQRRRCSELEF